MGQFNLPREELLQKVRMYLDNCCKKDIYPLDENSLWRIVGGIESGMWTKRRTIKPDIVRGAYIDVLAYAIACDEFYYDHAPRNPTHMNTGYLVKVDPTEVPKTGLAELLKKQDLGRNI